MGSDGFGQIQKMRSRLTSPTGWRLQRQTAAGWRLEGGTLGKAATGWRLQGTGSNRVAPTGGHIRTDSFWVAPIHGGTLEQTATVQGGTYRGAH